MGKTKNEIGLDPERRYLNMLHVWEEILLSTPQRRNHLTAFNSGIEKYYQFLDKNYKNLSQLDYVQKQHISKLLTNLNEIFPLGIIPAGTIIFELRTDIRSNLNDKMVVLYFSEENEPLFLDDPYISKFYSNRLFLDQQNLFMCLQLVVSDDDTKNNEITLAIIKDIEPFPYPNDHIELFKSPNEKSEGFHDITDILKDSPEKVFFFDLREK